MTLDSFGSLFLLLGPMVIIVIGVSIVVVCASIFRGLKRWLCLFFGPALILLTAYGFVYLITTFINPSEGGGFLLGAVTMGIYFLALFAYYPVFIVVSLIKYAKKRKINAHKAEKNHNIT